MIPTIHRLPSEGPTVSFLVIAVLSASGSPAGGGACPHHYFPLEEGLVLTYRAGKKQVQVRQTQVRKTPDGVSAMLEVAYGGRSGRAEATCSREGIRTTLGGLEGLALQSLGLDVTVISSEGVTLPPQKAIATGKAWKNRLTVELRPPSEVKIPLGLKPVIRTTFTKESRFVGFEDVTVSAGTFHAIKLHNRTTASAQIQGASRTVEGYVWLAPEVGIVKIGGDQSADLELIEIQKPKVASLQPKALQP